MIVLSSDCARFARHDGGKAMFQVYVAVGAQAEHHPVDVVAIGTTMP
jgi:hypothetical protein